MTAQDLYDGVARAVEVAKPAQEYCFLWINHWSTCMTKGEWSGWMQAVFSVLAIMAAIGVAWWHQHRQDTEARSTLETRAHMTAFFLLPQIETLVSIGRKFTSNEVSSAAEAEMHFELFRQLALRVGLPSEEQIFHIRTVGQDCAKDLFEGVDSFKRAIHRLEFGLEGDEPLESEQVLDLHAAVVLHLVTALVDLLNAQEKLKRYVEGRNVKITA